MSKTPFVFLTFLKGLLLNPRTMGAVLPSSTHLARSMASCIDTKKPGFIVELGPGTGVITEAILKLPIAHHQIISLELAPHFAKQLKQQFPDITVIEGNAMQLSALLQDKKPIHTIISSLPLRSLSKKDREHLFSEIQKTLMPNGQFIQFTYSLKTDADFYPQNFILKNSFMVWRNIPPAKITVFEVRN